jgi:hypothetical protein
MTEQETAMTDDDRVERVTRAIQKAHAYSDPRQRWQKMARAALAAAEPQWQPIETAPRDGTLVLLARPNKSVIPAFWNTSSDISVMTAGGGGYQWARCTLPMPSIGCHFRSRRGTTMSDRALSLSEAADRLGCVDAQPERRDNLTMEQDAHKDDLVLSLGGDRVGTIYVIQAMPGTPVKIGFTTHDDLTRRVAGLQTGNPHPLRVLACTKGKMRDERAIHAALSAERLTGEWFDWSARTIAFIDHVVLHGLDAAIEMVRALQEPDAPSGWDRLWLAESNVHGVFMLRRTNLLSEARLAGNGPPFTALPQDSRRTARYYRLDDLKRWFVANNIPHSIHRHLWALYVIEQSAEDEAPE